MAKDRETQFKKDFQGGLEEIEISSLSKSRGEKEIDEEFHRVSELFQDKAKFARNGILETYSLATLTQEILECNGEISRADYFHGLYKDVRGVTHPEYEKARELYSGVKEAMDIEIKSRIGEQ